MSKYLRDLLMHKGGIVADTFDSILMLACTQQVACLLPETKGLMTAEWSQATQEDDSPWEKNELVDLFGRRTFDPSARAAPRVQPSLPDPMLIWDSGSPNPSLNS